MATSQKKEQKKQDYQEQEEDNQDEQQNQQQVQEDENRANQEQNQLDAQKNTNQNQLLDEEQTALNLQNQHNNQDSSKSPAENSAINLSQNHLPKTEYEKSFLLQKIDNSIKLLKQIIQNIKDSSKNQNYQENLKVLQLRKKLISASRQYSNQRIDHLQLIFKHYCTHIFKTGKHMTFQRLQYEKVHLTLDRLFIFLKDFGLTVMKVNSFMKDVVQKSQIIKTFKKVSSNCRDLTFQQFIICLQKIAVLYYDCKTTYFVRKEQERAYKKKVKAILLKKQKIKQQMLRRFHQKQDQLQIGQKSNNKTEQQEQNIDQNNEKNQNQNDDMMQNLMNIKSSVQEQIENQRKSKKKVKNNNRNGQQENENENENDEQDGQQKQDQNGNVMLTQGNSVKDDLLKENEFAFDPTLLTLTMQEKIQNYYQLIDVDNVQSFRNKLRQLNLPLFQTHHQNQAQTLKNKKAASQTKRQAQKKLGESQSNKISQSVNQQNQRLKQLRERLNERNDKLKQSVPLVSPDQYQKMKRKRSDFHQRMKESTGNRAKKLSVRKIDLTQNQINLSSLSKLAYDNVNLSKFHPHNLYSEEADDDIFLRQYDSSPIKKHKKTTSSMSKVSLIQSNIKNNEKLNVMSKLQRNQKSSQDILLKTKKRLQEMQTNEKKSQLDQLYRLNDRTNRQKRLIQKFMDRQKK